MAGRLLVLGSTASFMRVLVARFFLFFLITSSALNVLASGLEPSSFEDLLSEAQLSLLSPEGFVVQDNRAPCDQTLFSEANSMLVCVMVRPIARMSIDYEDPHSSAPDPNQIFPLLFDSLLNELSDYSARHVQAFSVEDAESRFNAHWAQAASFSLKEHLPFPHREALLIALHRHKVADAYILVSYAAPDEAKRVLSGEQPLLRFSD